MIETLQTINWAHPLTKYYLSAALVVWPAMVICARFGVSRLGAGLLVLPYIGFAALCVYLAVKGRDKAAAVPA